MSNELRSEKSPYLRQHADNPVDWLPWGPGVFTLAAAEDKPIFLSIGYSTCHWCHVMAEESFSDLEVATLLNRDFINVKVDREERPDIDAFYMSACQALTGRGGWPLTVFLTPDKKPFFAGTYFPKTTKFGQIGMVELLPRVAALWHEQRAEIEKSGSDLVELLRAQAASEAGQEPGEAVLSLGFRQLAERFDDVHGGFGPAPKFLTPHNLTFLLRYHHRTGSRTALSMVESTLNNMRRGGVFDHVGFGFHRYSTDEEWRVPHFEKMLYDQALMSEAYLEAYQVGGAEDYAQTARDIFTYVLRDLTDGQGGFFSAEDADTEGEEGKFYYWSAADLDSVLNQEDAFFARQVFGIEETGNNILHVQRPSSEVAAELQLTPGAFALRLETIRNRLFNSRLTRTRPHRDDKILADWNGLMIGALAKGARTLREPAYAVAAGRAADFVLLKMRDDQGRLWHRYREGEAAISGYVDDYAFMVSGLLDLYDATYDPVRLGQAIDLSELMVKQFWDDANGALFHTGDDGETLFVRRKETYDGAVPAGNSVAAASFLRLFRLTGRIEFEERARGILLAVSQSVSDTPIAYTRLLSAIESVVAPGSEVVIVGDAGADDTQTLIDVLRTDYQPHTVSILRDMALSQRAIDTYTDFTAELDLVGGRAAAYVCRDHTCDRPTTDPEELRAVISGGARGGASSV